MGGNALNFKTRRVNRGEFFVLKEELVDLLFKLYPTTSVYPLLNYLNKPDYGDIDILVKCDPKVKYSFSAIKSTFGSKDYALNSNYWSFDYKDFQVDLIFVEPENWESSKWYFGKGDCGNLLGRIAHKMGLKLGHKGLLYVVNHGNYPFAEIVLSQNYAEILPFLGLSFADYCKPFYELEDIFKFVASSRFFNSDIFLWDNQNHHNRTRNRKRPMYCAFLEWCKQHPELSRYNFPDNKEAWSNYIEDHFPGFLKQRQIYLDQIDTTEKFKKMYNGEIVSSITGLSGKELGIFMASFRAKFENKDEMMKKVLDNGQGWLNLEVGKHYSLCKH